MGRPWREEYKGGIYHVIAREIINIVSTIMVNTTEKCMFFKAGTNMFGAWHFMFFIEIFLFLNRIIDLLVDQRGKQGGLVYIITYLP